MQTTRSVFVLSTQLKTTVTKVPGECMNDEALLEKWIDNFLPHYIVCTTRMQLEAVIRKINKYQIYNYCFTEVTVNTYALPDKIQLNFPESSEQR